jgi:hypothetical protein
VAGCESTPTKSQNQGLFFRRIIKLLQSGFRVPRELPVEVLPALTECGENACSTAETWARENGLSKPLPFHI